MESAEPSPGLEPVNSAESAPGPEPEESDEESQSREPQDSAESAPGLKPTDPAKAGTGLQTPGLAGPQALPAQQQPQIGLVTEEARRVLAMSKGVARVKLEELGPALFNRRGARTCGRHCHDLGRRIITVEGFSTYRYVAGWCHEPDEDDMMAVSRHGNAMADQDPLLPRLPHNALKGVFSKTHLVTFLQLLKAGTHRWAGTDELMVPPASSQASSHDELNDVLREGIFMHVFPWSAVRDHYDAIVALMASDNFDHSFGLVDSEVRCLEQVCNAISDIPVPLGSTQWEVVVNQITRLGSKWSPKDLENFWVFAQTTCKQQMDFIVAVWHFAQCESVLRVESTFFGHLAAVPPALGWTRACLAIAHFLSDREKECTFIGGSYVAGAIKKPQMQATKQFFKDDPSASKANEDFLVKVFGAYYYDLPKTPAFANVGREVFLKSMAAFALKAAKALSSSPCSHEFKAKLEGKVRRDLSAKATSPGAVLPNPIVPASSPGEIAGGVEPSSDPPAVLSSTHHGEVKVSFQQQVRDLGFTKGTLVKVAGSCDDIAVVKGCDNDAVIIAFGDEETRNSDNAPTTRVDPGSLTLVPAFKKRKLDTPLVPHGVKWASASDADNQTVLMQMAWTALYQLYHGASAAHEDLRLVKPDEWAALNNHQADSPDMKVDGLLVVTAKPIKKGALAIIPWGNSISVVRDRKPRGSVGISIRIGLPEKEEEMMFCIKPNKVIPPSDVTVQPEKASALTPFWLLALCPEPSDDTKKTCAGLVYTHATAKIPTCVQLEEERGDKKARERVPSWRCRGDKAQITLKFPIMTNDRDLAPGVRLYIESEVP